MTINQKYLVFEIGGAAIIALIMYHFGWAWQWFLLGVVAGEVTIRLRNRYKKGRG